MKEKIENIFVIDLKNGFLYDNKTKIYTCIFCNTQYEEGDIYNFNNRLVDAKKMIKLHITEKHGTVFENLISINKVQTGLTDTQKEFLENYYSGMSDKEIAKNMNISTSTVRYQRHNFREKVKQAKLILALSELLKEKEETKKNLRKFIDENNEKLESFFDSV